MPIIVLSVVIVLALAVGWTIMTRKSDITGGTKSENKKAPQDTPVTQKRDPLPGTVTKQINKPEVIDYNELAKESIMKDLMAARKKDLGLDNSVDLVVKSDESFTVGSHTVSMEKVIEQAFAGRGKVLEKELDESGAQKLSAPTTYGIYVVQPGDNIWNIHFRMLKDYYIRKGIDLKKDADEPESSGLSSGVGKILKFSETMVTIYNVKEKQVTEDINIIDPLSKVVIYNMDEIFALLEQIDFNTVDRLRFDGCNIWIPVH